MSLLAPEITQEQNQLLRRQQMADLLRQHALQPNGGTEMVSGWAVKKSPLEGLSKIAQALGSRHMQNGVDERQLELAKALQERMGTAFDSMSGGSAPAAPQMENRQDPEAMGPQAAGPSAPLPGVQAPVQAPPAQATNPQINAIRNQAKAAYLMGNTQLANQLIANISTLTEGAKANSELGIGTPQARELELAKRSKEGTMSLQPGQTNIMPNGSRIVAPNFETGVAGGFNPQGQPIASEVPGSAQIAANRAGMVKQAEAAVSDKFAVPAKVDAVGGPVALTPAQQRAQANGGVDPANANPMAPRAGDSDQAAIYKGEMKSAQDRLAAAKTPEERTRAQSDIDGLTRETKRLGIKLQDDTSRKFGEQVASKSADSLLEGRDKAKAASDSLVGIQKARSAIAGTVFQGSGAETKLAVSKFINANIPGVNIDPEKVSNTDYLKSTLGASLLAEAKTLGSNPSNADASRINDIVGSITKDPGAMAKILDWRQEMAERSIKNHNDTVGDAETRGMTSPYDLRVKGPVQAPTPDAPQAATPSASPKSFNALPSPAEFSGKRMRAPDGSVLRSNGKAWVKE
jgi:hypothetical protein